MSDKHATSVGDRSPPVRRAPFGLLGIVCAGLTIGFAELLSAIGQFAGLLRVSSSPLTAVGDAFIGITPGWLQRWAIQHFGTSDKDVLLGGMAVTILLAAFAIGVLARNHLLSAVGAIAVLVGVMLMSIWTSTGTKVADGLPTLAGSLVGTMVLAVACSSSRSGLARVHSRHVADASPGPRDPSDDVHGRRRFLRLTLVAAAVAAVTAAVSRLIPTADQVQASRARVKIPVPTPDTGPTTDEAPPRPLPESTGTTAQVDSPSRSLPATGSPSHASGTPTMTSGAATSSTAAPAPVPLSPSSFDPIAGISPYLTTDDTFYRIDTTLIPPLITAENWILRVHGMVRNPFTINYLSLIARPQIEREITLVCVSNDVGGHLVGNTSWIGTRLSDLLAQAQPLPGADCLLSTSADGFTCSTPLSVLTDGRDAILAVAMGGQPLPIEHGFPVRMVVPGLYGYVSATKWVVDLEVTMFSKVTAYWTARGWSDHGPIKISSRIDVPGPASAFSTRAAVTFAGVAWAPHRGISAVQIQVDDGPWLAADLAGSSSKDTWRQWRYRWTATAGHHVVRCRAVDGDGVIQAGADHDALPDGATGYASVSIFVS